MVLHLRRQATSKVGAKGVDEGTSYHCEKITKLTFGANDPEPVLKPNKNKQTNSEILSRLRISQEMHLLFLAS